jgi:putative DNA methylase
MEYKKKLIEVALPLEAINAASSREKSIRHGHPSTLHLWWARRPLATARAVIWSSLVDDPSSLPEQFPTEEAQNAERQRLFGILERLVKWENTNNEEVLAEAKAEIMKSTDGNPPALLDPFAGGGAIPLEAQRLGLEAHASDLNPVAVMINKAMIEIPPKFAGQPPVNPESCRQLGDEWKGAQGLAEDVRYYGEWMKKKAFEKIGYLYPKVKDEHGQEHIVIAWIWTRTVKCPNPACGCEMPLASSFELSKKKGKKAYIQPIIEGKNIRYEVKYGKNVPEPPKTARGAKFKCIRCGEATTEDYIRSEATSQRLGQVMVGIIAESNRGRIYLSPDDEQTAASNAPEPDNYPTDEITYNPRDFRPPYYGLNTYGELFTHRQLNTLSTLQGFIHETKQQVIEDATATQKNYEESTAYGNAIAVYLAFLVDKMTDYHSSLCTWHSSKELIRNTFGRQAVGITWDYSEANPFSNSAGCFDNMIDWVAKALNNFPQANIVGRADQRDAQSDNGMRGIMVSTDPPYYNNIAYADLSDYFYVWLRRSLREIYPDLFRTMLVPKAEELVANPYRFEGGTNEAQQFFEDGMLNTFVQINTYAREDIPVSVYYAYKQSDSDENDNTASTGWETMLSAIIKAGFLITGTWPMRTEMANRAIGIDANALASSIVLVCRKRPGDASICTRRDFINALKRELKPALKKLQQSNIAPVDLAQSAIGPGMGVYSRFSKVLEADGTPMSVRSALQIINQELDLYFSEQDGELDRDSRFCVDLYTQYAFNDMKFGEADVLARAKNTSVEKLRAVGVLYAEKGVVRLLTREEIPEKITSGDRIIWLLTQQLTRAMEKEGVVGAAEIVADIFTSEPEHAKALAYRLFQIAERKGWAGEAYAYNSLVIAWPEIQSKAADITAQRNNAKQMTLFDIAEND